MHAGLYICTYRYLVRALIPHYKYKYVYEQYPMLDRCRVFLYPYGVLLSVRNQSRAKERED